MRKIFGKPGSSFQVIGGIKPEGFVEMPHERPEPDYVCHNNYDGTGAWVQKSTRENILLVTLSRIFRRAKTIIADTQHRITLAYYLRLANRGYPTVIKYSFCANLLTAWDRRKATTFLCFFIPLACIYSFGIEERTSYALLLSVCAAAIFDFFITIMPREYEKRRNASEIVQILDRVIEVKRAQYIGIGHISHPLDKIPPQHTTDPALNRDKAIALKALISSNQNSAPSHDYLGPDIAGLIFHDTNQDLFKWAENYFTSQLNILMQEVKPDLFPLFYNALKCIAIERDIAMRMPMSGDHGIECYITHQFKCIETLELYFMLDCQRYIEPMRRGMGPTLKYDRDSLCTLLSCRMGYFDFNVPPASPQSQP